MYAASNLTIGNKTIKVFLDKKKSDYLQDFLDKITTMASLLGYSISVESSLLGDFYDFIHIERQDNSIKISFQHYQNKTTCYCLHNGEQVSISQLIKRI